MNHKTNYLLVCCSVLLILILSACAQSPEKSKVETVNLAAEESAIQMSETPTVSPVPTETQAPTELPTPTQTVTPESTPTATITLTPLPTDTPEPTVPLEPTLGEIFFFDDDFEAPIDEFRLGVAKVHACFEYWNMAPGLRISGYVYHNGKEWANISSPYDLEGNDFHCFTLSIGGGKRRLDPGRYELKLYLEKDLATSGKFSIGY